MKTVKVLLKTSETMSFPNAAVQEKEDGGIAIYEDSYRIVAEFKTHQIQKWWYEDVK